MGKFTIASLAGACFLNLAGCSTIEDSHGFMPPAQDVAEIEVGLDTRDTVSVILGRPGTTGVLTDDAWYYVQSDYETVLWRAPEEVSREVLAVSFDDKGVVTNIERFGLEDGRIVVLSRRVTDTTVKGVGLLRQILSNVGNLSAGQLLDE